MRQVMVGYKVKPDQVERNEELVRAVYDELHELSPNGFRYSTFKLDDGVSFVHIARGTSPLPGLGAFRRFQEDIEARCDEPPVVREVTTVGSYEPDR